jgi:hypothetical protein
LIRRRSCNTPPDFRFALCWISYAAGTKTADIYTNVCGKKKGKKTGPQFTGEAGEKTRQAAAAEAARPGRSAGGGAYGGPYRRFGSCVRRVYSFSYIGEKDAGI